MAKEIRQWKTDDGKLFDTLEEAEKHECLQKEIKLLRELVEGAELPKMFGEGCLSQFIVTHKPELLDILYLKGKFKDVAFTRKDLLETAGLPPEKSKNGKTDPELKIKQPVQSSSSKSRMPVKLVRPEVLTGK